LRPLSPGASKNWRSSERYLYIQVLEAQVRADAKRLVPDAKWMGEALWINNSNRSKSDELVKEWWKQ